MKPFSFTLALTTLLFLGRAMAIEEPSYQVLRSEEGFEIRHYAPMLIAEATVVGDMDEASSTGFRLIADFIFGNNQKPDASVSEKIAMTAPVTVEPKAEKIAMTAPVTVEPQSQGVEMAHAQSWRIHFVMPSQYTMASIPKPKNSAVQLREVPSQFVVVHSYSGFNGVSKVQTKMQETIDWALKNHLKPMGTPRLSRYDPPWTLPMFRRNEIMVEIEDPRGASR